MLILPNLITKASTLYNSVSSLKCNDGYVQTYLGCYKEENLEKAAFFYSGSFTPFEIEIPIKENLVNYAIEFWVQPDIVHPPNDGTYESQTSPEIADRYIFFSNVFTITRNYNYTREDNYRFNYLKGDTKCNNFSLPYNQWSRIAMYVTQNTHKDLVNFTVNFFLNSENICSDTTTYNLTLKFINFCHNKKCGTYYTSSNNIQWFSAFYKKFKIWNGQYMPLNTFKEVNK